ncbi:MAG: hypothetical protein CM15mP58_07850 [Burkholderiaceae bacterium]|nr:MAG: hypothetical protein CM15mP58_07850 [Burkholderiaceae bacterium]
MQAQLMAVKQFDGVALLMKVSLKTVLCMFLRCKEWGRYKFKGRTAVVQGEKKAISCKLMATDLRAFPRDSFGGIGC